MGEYPRPEVDRGMKVQEVIMRAMTGELPCFEAAEILGVSCRTIRRWKRRDDGHGYDGLLDQRRQRPGPKRVPMETVQEILRLYREAYEGLNISHVHEKLLEEHRTRLSYE